MASRRIIGNAEILGNLKINGKYALRSFNGFPADSDGKITYPYYDKEEVDQLFDMLPVSRVGDQDYLPLSVNGTFEGASAFSFAKIMQPCIVENDGTGVILRAGTNGSSYGYYYAYIKNIRDLETLTQDNVITTNTIYRPSVLPSTDYIYEFYGSNAYELLFWESTDRASYYLTLTNETLNESAHKHCRIPKTAITNKPIYAHIVNDSVYIWCMDSSVLSSVRGCAFIIYTVPLSAFDTGSVSTVTQISDYSGRTIRDVSYTASKNIRVYDSYSVAGSGGDALIAYDNGVSRIDYWENNVFNTQAVLSPDGTKIRVAIYPGFRVFTTTKTTGVYALGISFTYDISTKTMTLDGTERGPIRVSANTSTGNVTVNNPFSIKMENFTGFYDGALGNYGSICQTADGFVFTTKARWSSTPTYAVQTYKVSGTPYDSWVAKTRTASNLKRVEVMPVYGSPIGENLIGVRFVDKRKILVACSGTENGISYGYDSTVFAEIGDKPNYSYKNLEQNTIMTGFAPSKYRHYLSTDYKYAGMITLIDANGNVTAYGSSLIEGINKPAYGRFDPDTMDFDSTTRYEISGTTLSGIGYNAIAKAGLTNITEHKTVFYYVPDNTYSKSIAVTSALNKTTNVCYLIFSEISCSTLGTSGTIIIRGISVDTTRYTSIPNTSQISANEMVKRWSGITVSKYNGFNYLGVNILYGIDTPGWTRYPNMIAKVKNGVIASQRYMETTYISNAQFDIGTIPDIGFGYYQMNKNDYQTKSVFAVCGTTEAEMDKLISGNETISQYLVVASQDVAEGYNVYFTQDVPVFLGGKFAKIPPTMLDLLGMHPSPENPGEETFYIYAVMDRNSSSASYMVSTSKLAETMTSTYIGKVMTDSNGIVSIESEKVTRFLLYRPSTYARGAAIPASSGFPSQTSTRWSHG